jgi:3-methyladenine DNA glycosylase AlkD
VTEVAKRVAEALAWLERRGTKRTRDEMRSRYGIVAAKAFGVPVGAIKGLGTRLGRDHALAIALWKTGWYEARMLTSYVDDPARVTPTQMDRWARDFDNWGICDTVCFHLFDRTPHAWRKVEEWSDRPEEFVRRAAFALVAGLALHDKDANDARFLAALRLIEAAAADERHFVKKGVSWALRVVGRRGPVLHSAAVDTARRLAGSPSPAARGTGKESLRELTSPMVRRRVRARRAPRKG